MRPVFDAAALIAWFNEEPAADEVDRLFEQRAGWASCVNLAEVADVLSRVGRIPSPHVVAVLDALVDDGLTAVACDRPIGLRAGVIRSGSYHKTSMPVSLADCVAIATAEAVEGTLVSSDRDLIDLAGTLGVAVHPIVNSLGER